MFWLIAGLLLAGVLLLVLPPLLASPEPDGRNGAGLVDAQGSSVGVYRDQWAEAERDVAAGLLAPDRLEQARDDIRARLAEEAVLDPSAARLPARGAATGRLTGVVVGVMLVAGSVMLYRGLGKPQAVDGHVASRGAPATADERHAMNAEQIQAMVARLSARLRQQPDDAEGWAMLARSYTVLGRYRDAAVAFGRANDAAPRNATLLADYADVLAMTQGRRLAGEPSRLIQAALDADPKHVKALALAGTVSFEAADYAAAQGYWERVLAEVPADSDTAQSIRRSLGEARRLEATSPAATGPGIVVAKAAGPVAATNSTEAITGVVEIAPELASRIAAGDTLFVFARAAGGSRMPLAIQRVPVGAWPRAFTLDDSQAMSPQTRLSSQPRVTVGVRISRSGNATPQSGDLAGESAGVATGTQGLRVVIDRVLP